ncbi:MAG: response regulator transcription factor, partial [Pyrinomonadaceae bacterium]|nr:response regulator transcription factor [Pyrinomonadaceae bacterium]
MSLQKPKPIRIFLVDDHQSIRDGYRMLLSVQPDFLVVGEASRSDQAIERTSAEQPDVILLDLDLGNASPESGLDIIPKLLALNKEARILILTGLSDVEMHQEAARRGALGLVNKEESFQLIIKAIRKVHAGEAW